MDHKVDLHRGLHRGCERPVRIAAVIKSVIKIPAGLILALSLTSSLFATLPEAEFRITRSTPGLAPNTRESIDLVTNGQHYLATWIDERAGWESKRLVAARVNQQGTPLDPIGIGVSEINNVASFVSASDGADYLVAWGTLDDSPLRLARIDGQTGHLEQLPVTEIDATQMSLAWIGDAYALIYRNSRIQGVDILFLALIDRDGRVLDQDIEILRPIGGMGQATLATIDGDLLVAWSTDTNLYATRIAGSSVRGSSFAPVTTGVLFAEDAMKLKLVTDGTRVFALYHRAGDSSAAVPLRARILDAAAQPVGAELDAGTSFPYDGRSDAVWTGQDFAVFNIAADAKSLTAIRFATDGTRVDDPPQNLASGDVYEVAAASVDGETIFLRSFRPGIGAIPQWISKRLGNVADGSIISFSEPDTGMPSVLWRGDHYLSIWLDAHGDKTEALFGRFAPDGTLLDAGPTIFGHTVGDRLAADTDGEDALIAWSERGGLDPAWLHGTIVRHDGSHVAIELGRARLQSELAVRWNGSEYLVIWATQTPRAVYGMRIASDGQLIDSEPVEIAPDFAVDRPAIAWDGTHWIVAYHALVVIDPNAGYPQFNSYIHAVRLTRALTRIGAPMRLSVAEPTSPYIAARAGQVLVAWGSTTEASNGYATRIAGGVVLDGPTGILLGGGVPTSVHADAQGFVVLEQGGRGWSVRDGIVEPSRKIFSFVPEQAVAEVVSGGPRALVVYRRMPVDGEQMLQVRAHYVPEVAPRKRAVRK